MANVFQNESLIAKVVLQEFQNNLVLTKTINRQFQDTFMSNSGATVNIRRPTRYTVTTGADQTGQIQDIVQRTVPLTISFQDNVLVSVTSEQMALNLDDMTREIINPAMLQLANKVDQRVYDTSLGIYNSVGTAGTAPNTFGIINDARTILTASGVRTAPRYACFNVVDGGALASGLQTYFNTSEFNKSLLADGYISDMCGFGMYQVQNTVNSLLSDNPVIGTPLVNGTVLTGATSIPMDGFTPGITIYEGSIFTISGVGSLNTVDRRPTGLAMNFVVTADTLVDGSGLATVPIAPTIIFSGSPYDNVSGLPADNAPVTFEASHVVNIGYHPEAFTLAMVKMMEPNGAGVIAKSMVDKDAGVSIRMTQQYNNVTDVMVLRFDVLYGVACFPEYATRIMGSTPLYA